MSSQVEISNKALSLIGANTIVNMADDTQEAKALINVYDNSLKSILGECDWNFATKRKKLVKIDETPEWIEDGMSNYFKLPTDYVRIFKTSIMCKWVIEGDRILTNVDDLSIAYVFDNKNSESYPAWFIDAFAHRLASDIAYELTNSTSNQAELTDLYFGQYLPIAKSKNAQDKSKDIVEDNYWSESVYGTRWG